MDATMRNGVKERRIQRAHETQVALARLEENPSPENVAALHRLHAAHLREDGDLAGAKKAEARAMNAERKSGNV